MLKILFLQNVNTVYQAENNGQTAEFQFKLGSNASIKLGFKKLRTEEWKVTISSDYNKVPNMFMYTCLWSIDLINRLEKDLLAGERKVEVWANSVGVSTIDIPYENIDPFFNINTKEDFNNALKIIDND